METAAKKKDVDEKLVQDLKNGDSEAFEQLVELYQKKIYALAFNMTHSQMDAQDITQDVLLSIFRKVHTFQGKSAFSSWIYRVTLNAVYMKLRSKKKEQAVSLEDAFPTFNGSGYHQDKIRDWTESAESLLFTNETKGIIQKAVNQLPEKEKVVFILRDVEGLSTEHVGDILDLSTPAVKSRLHRARLFLRKKLSNYFDEYKEYRSAR